ncbi:unnamed protein product [Allacma fusca]|uniref:Uncharacterized protein n=1 Tax=Allacma fusca TaxID=39272 RepID=A0A8J2KM83_9HEXA|nr:unnamed protein product [Allacma fusca]
MFYQSRCLHQFPDKLIKKKARNILKINKIGNPLREDEGSKSLQKKQSAVRGNPHTYSKCLVCRSCEIIKGIRTTDL